MSFINKKPAKITADKAPKQILKACKELRNIKAQAMKLVLALDNIPDARLYESAVATDISVSKLERFQLTYPKKSA